MDFKDKVLQLIRTRGPVLPSQINKEIEQNVLFTSAILSELVDSKQLRLSHTKIGGSPVYYLPGQESRLEFLYKQLHEKEQKAFDRLKVQKVLRDKEQEPVIRAALREIKDFARPLEVNIHGESEIFWKWYLLPTPDAGNLIKNILNIKTEIPKVEQKVEKKKVEVKQREEKRPEPQLSKAQLGTISAKQKFVFGKEKIEEKKEIKKEEPEKKEEKPFIDEGLLRDPFFKKIKLYFDQSNIKIINQKIIRKNSEIDLIIRIPSSVGVLDYYCKAKNKKRFNDGDLSSVFIQGQSRKMPTLLLITGELTKKAQAMLDNEFKGLSVKKV